MYLCASTSLSKFSAPNLNIHSMKLIQIVLLTFLSLLIPSVLRPTVSVLHYEALPQSMPMLSTWTPYYLHGYHGS